MDLNLISQTASKKRFKCFVWIWILSPFGPPKLLVPARSPRLRCDHSGHHDPSWATDHERRVWALRQKLGSGQKIWILFDYRKQDKIQMPTMSLDLISPRSSKTISSGQVPQIALRSLWSPWPMLTTGCPMQPLTDPSKVTIWQEVWILSPEQERR